MRAVEQARDEDRAGEAHCLAEEAEGERWGKKQKDRQPRQCNESTLHLVLHPPQNTTATATAAAPTDAATWKLQ